jgi:AcrR family transcriptional regulator
MAIPAPEAPVPAGAACAWGTLSPLDKRERLLTAAADVFARHGLDAPMSEVAEAAGAGVASVYRRFDSKHDLLAALVARRMDQIAAAATQALVRPGEHWTALTEMLTAVVSGQSADNFMGEARMSVADDPEVIAASARAGRAIDALLDAARTEGRLRADATALDLRLLFAATRAAKQVEPQLWPRMLELMIDALQARP